MYTNWANIVLLARLVVYVSLDIDTYIFYAVEKENVVTSAERCQFLTRNPCDIHNWAGSVLSVWTVFM